MVTPLIQGFNSLRKETCHVLTGVYVEMMCFSTCLWFGIFLSIKSWKHAMMYRVTQTPADCLESHIPYISGFEVRQASSDFHAI